MAARPRVLYLVHAFPQLSETYMATEIRALQATGHDVRVISFGRPDTPTTSPAPCRRLKRDAAIRLAIAWHRPDRLHTHWLTQVERVHRIAAATRIPFTVRTHSFDMIHPSDEDLARVAPLLDDDLCRGVLVFPFLEERLVRAGVRPEKIRTCWPVVDVDRFLDRGANGRDVMNVGACLAKKAMEGFVALAARVPDVRFRLYAIGYESPEIAAANARAGRPLEIVPPKPHEQMPREYKRHRWLVYTARREPADVGWPCAVAEAQAAGVGVCVPGIRPDLRTYAGEGAAIVYDSVDELVDVVRRPPDAAMREAGFEQARRSDVRRHLHLLTEMWA